MSSFFSKLPMQLLGLLTIGVIAGGGAVLFVWNDVHAVHAKNAEVLRELALAQARVDQLAQVRAAASAITEDREQLNTYLTRESEVIHLLDEIERLGQVTGTVVEIQNVEAIPYTLSEQLVDVPTVRITVEIEGDWSAVYATIALIERLPKFSVMKEAGFVRDVSTGEWTAVITMILPQRP